MAVLSCVMRHLVGLGWVGLGWVGVGGGGVEGFQTILLSSPNSERVSASCPLRQNLCGFFMFQVFGVL